MASRKADEVYHNYKLVNSDEEEKERSESDLEIKGRNNEDYSEQSAANNWGGSLATKKAGEVYHNNKLINSDEEGEERSGGDLEIKGRNNEDYSEESSLKDWAGSLTT